MARSRSPRRDDPRRPVTPDGTAPSGSLPVPSDVPRLLRRLADEERTRRHALASLEERARQFADVERPAYERWLRLEFGPALTAVDELRDELRSRQTVAHRVAVLMDDDGLDPREALYVVTIGAPPDARQERVARERDEVDARRRAKLDRKRADRKAAKRAQRAATPGDGAPRDASARHERMIGLYRALARRLHPDSPTAIRSLAPSRVRSAWSEVQAAYGAHSVERLLAVYAWVEALGDASNGDGAPVPEPPAPASFSLSERYARLRALDRACAALERRLKELERDPAWDFTQRREHSRHRLRRAASQAIDREREQVQAAFDDVEEFLASLGPPRAPRAPRPR